MSRLTALILILVVAVLAPLFDLHAQTQVSFYHFLTLDDNCSGSGNPLPDGTPIMIMHDWNSNGPDALDTLPRLCDNPPACATGPIGSVNSNVAYINGTHEWINVPGGFAIDETYAPNVSFMSVGQLLAPNRIYLRICAGNIYYSSEIFSPELNTWNFYGFDGIANDTIHFICQDSPIYLPAPALITATDDSCDAVRVSWSVTDATGLDSFFVWRDHSRVGTVNATEQLVYSFFHYPVTTAIGSYYVTCSNNACTIGLESNRDNGSAAFNLEPIYGVVASDGRCDGITISWNPVPGASSYRIYRTQGSIQTIIAIVSGIARSFVDISALPGVPFIYAVSACNSCGCTPPSFGDAGWQSEGIPPPPPTNVVATDGNCNSVTITWTGISGVLGYKIYRVSQGSGITETLSTNIPPDVTQFIDTTPLNQVVYDYRVRAFIACGDGALSAPESGYAFMPPLQVQNVRASTDNCHRIRLMWNDLAYENGYRIYRDGVLLATATANSWGYTDSTAVPLSAYQYSVTAFNNCGEGPFSNPASGLRLGPPGETASINATTDGCLELQLEWTPVTHAEMYFVFRADSDGTNPVFVDTVYSGLTSHTFWSAPCNTPIQLFVRAWNACGLGPVPAQTAIGRQLCTPNVTGNVHASDGTACGSVSVSWDPVPGASDYRVLRTPYLGGLTDTFFISGTATQFTDISITPLIQFIYQVQAVNACGAGEISSGEIGFGYGVSNVGIAVTASDGSNCRGIELNWTDSLQSATDYLIYRNGEWIAEVHQLHSYLDTTAAGGMDHWYTIAGRNDCGLGPQSAGDFGSRGPLFPLRPQGLMASDTFCDAVHLTWRRIEGAEWIQIWRSGILVEVIGGNETSFEDWGIEHGVHALYTIRGMNSCGEGPVSDVAMGSRLPARVSVIEPNGGEIWPLGQTRIIRWMSCSASQFARIDLFRYQPEPVWLPLIPRTANDGIEEVHIPDIIPERHRIRVVLIPGVLEDSSDAFFETVPSGKFLAVVRASEPHRPLPVWDLGRVNANEVIQEQFRLVNIGDEMISISRVDETPGAQFSVRSTYPAIFPLAPGAMLACSLIVSFRSSEIGDYLDSVRIACDAVNARRGSYYFMLHAATNAAEQAPRLVIRVSGSDVILHWDSPVSSWGEIERPCHTYLIFESHDAKSRMGYVDATPMTSYRIANAIEQSPMQFYQVICTDMPIEALPIITPGTTMEDVQRMISTNP